MLHGVTLVRNKDIRKLYVQAIFMEANHISLDGIYCTDKTTVVQEL